MINEENKLKHTDKRCSYIDSLFDYLYPDEEPYFDWWCVAFPNRYNDNKINFQKTYEDYLSNKDLQDRINAFGLETEFFWYFILFLYDISHTKSVGFVAIKESAKDQFENFLEAIDSTMNLDERGVPILDDRKRVTFKNDVQIEIKINGRKQNKVVINNKKAIYWLSVMMERFKEVYINYKDVNQFLEEYESDDEFEDYEKNPDNKQRILDYGFIKTDVEDSDNLYLLRSKEKFDASVNYRNFLITYYIKEFFHLNASIIKKGKCYNDNNLYNKDYFIGVILCFIGTLIEKQDKIEYVKKNYKYYKDYDIKGYSVTGAMTYK